MLAKKKKFNRNDLSFTVTRFNLLQFVVTCCFTFTSCHLLCHSFSLLVSRYIIRLPFYQQSLKKTSKDHKKTCTYGLKNKCSDETERKCGILLQQT